jgi:MtN3 and saliva related transmembrane protein
MTAFGTAAAVLTSLSYVPQVRKALPKDSTKDLSIRMLIALTSGLALWVAYGLLKGDWVIALANLVGGSLVGLVLICKARDMVEKR